MYGNLPVTGAGLVIGGVMLGSGVLVAIAVGLVVAGAISLRFGWRGRKPLDEA